MGRKKCFTNRKKQRQNKLWRETHIEKSQSIIPRPPTSSLSESSTTCPATDFHHIRHVMIEGILPLPSGWTIVSTPHSTNKLTFCYLQQGSDCPDTPTVSYTFVLCHDLTYTISAFDHQNVKLPNTTPTAHISDANSVLSLLQYIPQLKLCPGNSLPVHLQLADSRGGTMVNRQG